MTDTMGTAAGRTEVTTCPMDCPDTCALEVEVKDDRVMRIGGRRDHPDTAGFICSKIAHFDRRLDHPDRLLRPLRRVGPKGSGRFEPISWVEAIETVTSELGRVRDRWGGEAILPFHYGGSNGFLTDGLTDDLFFARLGASQLEKTICAAPTTAVATGMYGKMPGVAFGDYPKARFILIWGANPRASNIHLAPYLKRARAAGAFVAVVDPRQIFSPRDVDLHLPVRPGTDLPLALAMIGEWARQGCLDDDFLDTHAIGLDPLMAAAAEWSVERAAEVSGVSQSAIQRLAGEYAAASPAVLRCGWGLERNRNGGQAVAAILAMPALLGKFGVVGGGYTMSNSGAVRFDAESVVGPLDWNTRRLNMTRLGHLLTSPLEPRIQALFVYNANPLATVPSQALIEQGLGREDLFTVVFDQVMTDTCAWADVVLPATTFLEHWDLRRGYGTYFVGGVRPVVEPRGEARSNQEVFGALGRAQGFEDEAFTWTQEEALARVAPAVEGGRGAFDVERFQEGHGAGLDFPGAAPVQFGTVAPRTEDGRIDLTPAVLGEPPYRYQPLPTGGPLALITPASSRLISSTLGEVDIDRLLLTIHPQDAADREIVDGDRVRVFNDLGEVRCHAQVRSAVRPGVVSMPKGAWRRASLNGAVSTALCPDHVNEVAGGACFNDARVDVERLPRKDS